MAKKESKKIKNKSKRLDTKTLELGDFLQDQGIEQKNVIEVVTETGDTKVIDVGRIPLGPKAHFEQVIDPEILQKGPPFSIIVKNVNYDASVDEVIDYFGEISLNSQNKPSNDFSGGMGNNGGYRRGEFVFTVSNEDDLRKALGKDGTRMNNREIVVEIIKPGGRIGERGTYFSNSKQQNISRYSRMLNENDNGEDVGDWKAGRDNYRNQRPSTGGNQRQNKFDTANFQFDEEFDCDWKSAKASYKSTGPEEGSHHRMDNQHYAPGGGGGRRDRPPMDQDTPSDWMSAKTDFQHGGAHGQQEETPFVVLNSFKTEDNPDNWVSAKQDFQHEKQQVVERPNVPKHDDGNPDDWVSAKQNFYRTTATTHDKPRDYTRGRGGGATKGGFGDEHTKPGGSGRRRHDFNSENDLMASNWNEKKVEFQNNPPPQGRARNDDGGEFSNFRKNPRNGGKFRQNADDNGRGSTTNQKPRSKIQTDSIQHDENGSWVKNPNA